MARGKQAIASANRRAAASVAADIATYQRKIVELTEERNDLRAELARVRTETTELVRQLRAERDEAVGPQVAALRLKLERSQTDLLQHKANVAQGFRRITVQYGLQFPSHHFGAAQDALASLLGVSLTGSSKANRGQRRMTDDRNRKDEDMVAGGRTSHDPQLERLRQQNMRSRRRDLSERMQEKIQSK